MQYTYPNIKVDESKFAKNLILGDVEKAEVIYTAHYDTCAVMIVPNFSTPKNIVPYLIYQTLLVIAIFGLGNIACYLTNKWLGAYGMVAWDIVVYGILALMMFGPANKHTANDNTSGVITLVETYEAMSEDQRNKCAFVFFDNEELGLFGSMAFKKKYGTKLNSKLIVNFDCVSDGDTLMLVINKKNYSNYRDTLKEAFSHPGMAVLVESSKNTFYPSDQLHFSTGVGVAALNKSNIVGYYLDKIHTPSDTVFKENNIDYIKTGAIKLVDII